MNEKVAKRMTRSRRNGAHRERSERTELELLRTATLLFSERGFHGTGIRDIADTAGVAVSAMYYYAGSKEELLEVVILRGLDRLMQSAHHALDGVAGASERLATLIGVHVALHARNPRTTVVIDHEFAALADTARKKVIAERDAYEALWSEVLDDGVEAGEFIDRGSPGRLALLEMCTGVAHWYRPRGALRVPELCDRFADMGLSLMGAQRGTPLTVRDLELESAERFLRFVDIPTEPNRGRARS